jgi:hypothetical protein
MSRLLRAFQTNGTVTYLRIRKQGGAPDFEGAALEDCLAVLLPSSTVAACDPLSEKARKKTRRHAAGKTDSDHAIDSCELFADTMARGCGNYCCSYDHHFNNNYYPLSDHHHCILVVCHHRRIGSRIESKY